MSNTIIEDDSSELLQTLNDIKESIEFIRTNLPMPEVVTIKDISKILGVSVQHLKTHPYLLPKNGVSDFSTGHRRWKYETFLKWKKIPEKDRRDDYCDMMQKKFKG